MAKILIENGANVNAKNKNLATPLLHASLRGFDKVVSLLLKHGADKSIRNIGGALPVDAAFNQTIVNILNDAPLRPEKTDTKETTTTKKDTPTKEDSSSKDDESKEDSKPINCSFCGTPAATKKCSLCKKKEIIAMRIVLEKIGKITNWHAAKK